MTTSLSSSDSEDVSHSRASFPTSVKHSLELDYGNRCVICLRKLPFVNFAHVIDASAAGASHVSTAAGHGIISANFDRGSKENGMVQCPTCHLSFFTTDFVALSLPLPILKYLLRYIVTTPINIQQPLCEVFGLLTSRTPGVLPDTTAIEPYVGLFSMVVLNPTRLEGMTIGTPHFPPVSVIRDGQFVRADANTSLNAQGVARIFDSLSLTANSPRHPGDIPLLPEQGGFRQQRYWRIPVNMSAVLVTLQEQVGRTIYASEEVTFTQNIYNLLRLQQCYGSIPIRALTGMDSPSDDGSGGPGGGSGSGGPSGGFGSGGGGAGPSGDGQSPRKRKRVSKGFSKGKGKARAVAEPGKGRWQFGPLNNTFQNVFNQRAILLR